MAETCKSCGKQWQDHLGVEPTCALLQEAIALLIDAKETEPECGQPCETCGDYFSSHGEHASDCWHDQVNKLLDRFSVFASASDNQANATL